LALVIYQTQTHGGNPDMWAIFDYCNDNGVKPNVTVNGQGVDDETADNFLKLVAGCC